MNFVSVSLSMGTNKDHDVDDGPMVQGVLSFGLSKEQNSLIGTGGPNSDVAETVLDGSSNTTQASGSNTISKQIEAKKDDDKARNNTIVYLKNLEDEDDSEIKILGSYTTDKEIVRMETKKEEILDHSESQPTCSQNVHVLRSEIQYESKKCINFETISIFC